MPLLKIELWSPIAYLLPLLTELVRHIKCELGGEYSTYGRGEN